MKTWASKYAYLRRFAEAEDERKKAELEKAVAASKAGLYELPNAVDSQLESAWVQPLNL